MPRNDASNVTRLVGLRSHTVIPSLRSLCEPWHVATGCSSVQRLVQATSPREDGSESVEAGLFALSLVRRDRPRVVRHGTVVASLNGRSGRQLRARALARCTEPESAAFFRVLAGPANGGSNKLQRKLFVQSASAASEAHAALVTVITRLAEPAPDAGFEAAAARASCEGLSGTDRPSAFEPAVRRRRLRGTPALTVSEAFVWSTPHTTGSARMGLATADQCFAPSELSRKVRPAPDMPIRPCRLPRGPWPM